MVSHKAELIRGRPNEEHRLISRPASLENSSSVWVGVEISPYLADGTNCDGEVGQGNAISG